jgi:cytoskeletal protein CcmA (bactofilin family)
MWRKPETKPSSAGTVSQSQGTPKASSPSAASVTSSGVATAAPAAPVPAQSAAPPAKTPTSAPASAPQAVPIGAASSGTGAPSTGTRLSQGLKFRGDFSGESDLYIDSEFEGKINLPRSLVTIGPNGQVTCDINAREIHVEGSVKGDLTGDERIQIGRTGRVRGNLTCARLQIEDGAALQGGINIDQSKSQAKSGGNSGRNRNSSNDKQDEPVLKAEAAS